MRRQKVLITLSVNQMFLKLIPIKNRQVDTYVVNI